MHKQRKRKTFDWFYYGKIILQAYLFSYLISHLCFIPVYVEGQSMNPAIKEGTIGFSNIAFRHVFGLSRFDIVLIERDNQEIWVKRIIALPNETIAYKNNILYINGIAYPQPFLSDQVKTADFEPVRVGEDEVFVMGDNREHSYDSRDIGTVSISDIISKDVYAFLP